METFPLHEHHLHFIPNLRASRSLLTHRFARDCSPARCTAQCCRTGVFVDIAHRDLILANAALIRKYMDPAQEQDATRWFAPADLPDPDFPSGRGIDTLTANGACVFLDGLGRCTLQLTEAEVPRLKPFYCRAFPLVVMNATLMLDDEHCPGETCCCAAVEDGELSVFDVYLDELRFIVGDDGVEELQRVDSEIHSSEVRGQRSEEKQHRRGGHSEL